MAIATSVLLFGTLAAGMLKGTISATLAGAAIDQMIIDLDEAYDVLEDQITETEGERDRRLARIQKVYEDNLAAIEDETVTDIDGNIVSEGERARELRQAAARYEIAMKGPGGILEQIANLDAAKILAVSAATDAIAQLEELAAEDLVTYERLKKDLLDRLELTLSNLDQRLVDLSENTTAALERVAAEQANLIANRQLTLDDLVAQAGVGDAEAIRKTEQIVQTRDEMMAGVRDLAIIRMNEIGAQGKFNLGTEVSENEMEIAQEHATAAAMGFRRSGTPLMALRQISMRLQEEEDRRRGQIGSQLEGAATETAARLRQLRSKATMDVEDVAAANLIFQDSLERQRLQVEEDFAHNYENLDFTRDDINRQDAQDRVAIQADRDAANMQYTQDLGGLDAAEADRLIKLGFRRGELARELAGVELFYGTEGATGTEWARLEGERLKMEEGYTQEITDINAALDERTRIMLQNLTTQEGDLEAASSLVTAAYERQQAAITKEKTKLEKDRVTMILGALFTPIGQSLASAASMVSSASTIITPDWGGVGDAA